MFLSNATYPTPSRTSGGSGYFVTIGKPILNTYASLLLLIGIPGNIISAIIMGRPNGNRPTTRLLMVILSLADTAVLLTGVLRYWLMNVLDWDPRSSGPVACRAHIFAVAFSTDFAVGALCAIAVERFLLVAVPFKARGFVNLNSVTAGLTGYAVVVSGKNLSHFWTMGITPNTNLTDSQADNKSGLAKPAPGFLCKYSPEYEHLLPIFLKMDLITFAVLPYLILFSSNIYIYIKLKHQQNLLKRKSALVPLKAAYKSPPVSTVICECNNGCQTTVLVVVKRRLESTIKVLTALSVIHVVCTLPGTIYTFILVYSQPSRDNAAASGPNMLKVSLVMLVFTNNAINIFGYYVSCLSFRRSLKRLCFQCLW